MAASGPFTFVDVMVSIPTGLPGHGEATFVQWSAGTLVVNQSHELSFDLAGATHLGQKRLGCLLCASGVLQVDQGRTLDVKTEGSGSGPQLYRIEFRSSKDAQVMADIADSAQSKEYDAWHHAEGARSDREATLEEDVRRTLKARVPLVHRGMQLYGADPGGDAGSEVLLGEGVIALLDPPARSSERVGNYEILFYGEENGALEPVARFAIGPRMVLKELPREKAEFDDDEAPAVSFKLAIKDGPVHTVTFDDADQAAEFERDFLVRQRVMSLALASASRQAATHGRFDNLKKPFVWFWRRASVVLLTPSLMLALAAMHGSTRGPAAQICARTCAFLA